MEIIKVIIATLFSAAILFVIAKIIGHKQVAQLEFFDYVTGITIGSIAAELATTLDKPWWKPTVSMIIFGAVTVALSIATRRFPRSRKFINGTPTIVYIPPREHHLHGVLAPRSRCFSATLYGVEHHPL